MIRRRWRIAHVVILTDARDRTAGCAAASLLKPSRERDRMSGAAAYARSVRGVLFRWLIERRGVEGGGDS
ncbi:hypothetical protein WG70_22445 [Burkholderia oklahomensis EO147]|nr:hypothetical protein WG70_22445 [Burkholderia oklahomensis EO147]KUY52714.1 hypothetical protein WG70_00455 [Burkholderia oklahomensis EO147]